MEAISWVVLQPGMQWQDCRHAFQGTIVLEGLNLMLVYVDCGVVYGVLTR